MHLSNLNKTVLFGALLIGIVSLIIKKYTSSKIVQNEKNIKIVLTAGELAQYDGVQYENLYLSVLGSVFDVSSGAQHYAKGSSYHYFIGKDFSSALIIKK